MVERLGWTLVHFVWEGAAVAALLGVALGLARREAVRYGLALAALAVLAALPVATFLALGAPPTSAASGTLRLSAGEAFVGSPAPEASSRMVPLVALWALGVVLLSLRLTGTLLHLERWSRRHARPASPGDQARFEALARRLGLRRRVLLFLSDRIEVPSAWGVLRPVVVLPASLATGLPPAQVEGILLHELAHIRRHDYLVNLLQGVVETALFYHPAVWWASSIVRRERERLCDDVAVAALGDPMPYARALLGLEERRRVPRPALSAREGDLMNRIARLLAPKPAPARLSPLAPSLAALAVVALALGGTLHAEAQATKPARKDGTIKASSGSKQTLHRPGLDVTVDTLGDALRVSAKTKDSIAVGYYQLGDRDKAWHQHDIDLEIHALPSDRAAVRIDVRAGKSHVSADARLDGSAKAHAQGQGIFPKIDARTERQLEEAELRRATAEVAAAEARLEAARKTGRIVPGGGAKDPSLEVERAEGLAVQAQIAAARTRLEEAHRAIERSRPNDRRGMTYGVPGRAQAPVWVAEDYPEGVGVLTDAQAFAAAQRELWDASSPSPASSSAPSPRETLKYARNYGGELVQSRTIVAPAIPNALTPYRIDVQVQPPAKDAGSPASAETTQRTLADAQDALRKRLAASAAELTRRQVETKRAMDAARSAGGSLDRADLDRALAAQREALKSVNAETLRAIAQVRPVPGVPRGVFPAPGGFSSARGLFGRGGFGKGQGAFGAGPGGFKAGDRAFGKLQTAPPLATRSWTLSEGWNRYVTAGPGGTVNVDCEGASFKKVLRALVGVSGGSLVIAPGEYGEVNVILKGVSYRKALEVLCEAAGATLRRKDGVDLVGPRR